MTSVASAGSTDLITSRTFASVARCGSGTFARYSSIVFGTAFVFADLFMPVLSKTCPTRAGTDYHKSVTALDSTRIAVARYNHACLPRANQLWRPHSHENTGTFHQRGRTRNSLCRKHLLGDCSALGAS